MHRGHDDLRGVGVGQRGLEELPGLAGEDRVAPGKDPERGLSGDAVGVVDPDIAGLPAERDHVADRGDVVGRVREVPVGVVLGPLDLEAVRRTRHVREDRDGPRGVVGQVEPGAGEVRADTERRGGRVAGVGGRVGIDRQRSAVVIDRQDAGRVRRDGDAQGRRLDPAASRDIYDRLGIVRPRERADPDDLDIGSIARIGDGARGDDDVGGAGAGRRERLVVGNGITLALLLPQRVRVGEVLQGQSKDARPVPNDRESAQSNGIGTTEVVIADGLVYDRCRNRVVVDQHAICIGKCRNCVS